jgi:hypothetical protein
LRQASGPFSKPSGRGLERTTKQSSSGNEIDA